VIRSSVRGVLGATGAVVLAVGVLGLFGIVGVGAAASCAEYSSYSGFSLAAGQRLAQGAPGLLPVNEGDAGVPVSQAEYDSRAGSTARAGAPYRELVAGNVGIVGGIVGVGGGANDVPIFVVSAHPTEP
jgi:hypothetical protein